MTAGDTELRILPRAAFAQWEGGQGEQRCHQPSEGSQSSGGSISHTLGTTKLLCSVRASNSQQSLTASALPRAGGSSGSVG